MKIKYKLMLAMLGMMLILFVFNGYSMLNAVSKFDGMAKTVTKIQMLSFAKIILIINYKTRFYMY